MKQESLVSIITPTFNCGKYIHRLLDSVLMQTYPNIEMFICDDGSTDDTENILEKYVEKFKIRGYKLEYIKQKNSGQSVAINNLLKKVNGQYLVWPDADDFYASPEAIAKMVYTLSKTDDTVSMVNTLFSYVSEQDLHIEQQVRYEPIKNWFEACLFGLNKFHFCPGKYMAKMNVLDQVIPQREIYTEHDAGQNWQLMLPLLYKRNCVVIEEPLYKVLNRGDSHSRSKKNFEKKVNYIQITENIVNATLDSMTELSGEERLLYKEKVKIKCLKEKYNTAFHFLNKKYIKYFYSQMLVENKGKVSLKNKLIYFFPYLMWVVRKLYIWLRKTLHA